MTTVQCNNTPRSRGSAGALCVRAVAFVGRVPVRTAMFTVFAYQGLIRPFLFGTCRYCPSCSAYAIEALRSHGLLRGLRLTGARLLRCRPFAPGGFDPVPPRDAE